MDIMPYIVNEQGIRRMQQVGYERQVLEARLTNVIRQRLFDLRYPELRAVLIRALKDR